MSDYQRICEGASSLCSFNLGSSFVGTFVGAVSGANSLPTIYCLIFKVLTPVLGDIHGKRSHSVFLLNSSKFCQIVGPNGWA